MELDYGSLSSELTPSEVEDILQHVTDRNQGKETGLLPFATKNEDALRSDEEAKRPNSGYYKQNEFQRDVRRITFSNDYQRLPKKTQVCTMPVNDHITTRLSHTERVALISRSIARSLGANEDLAEAIARGHDIGHAPLGHLGEAFITRAIHDFNKKLMGTLGVFKHNIQSYHVVDRIASRRGIKQVGLNLTSQTKHGIISHDGEANTGEIEPDRRLTAERLEEDIKRYITDTIHASGKIKFGRVSDESEIVKKHRSKVLSSLKSVIIAPATIEACIVFIIDSLTYLPDDFEDMIRLDMIKRHELPPEIAAKLGNSGADMMNRMILDVIIHSFGKDKITYSKEIWDIVGKFKKDVMYPNYYALNSLVHSGAKDSRMHTPSGDIKRRMDHLFRSYSEALKNPHKKNKSSIVAGYLESHDASDYFGAMPDDGARNERAIVDYIAGFTDDFFFKESENTYI